jgi:hypothetical protein
VIGRVRGRGVSASGSGHGLSGTGCGVCVYGYLSAGMGVWRAGGMARIARMEDV